MKPVQPDELLHSVPVDGRGRTSPAEQSLIDERTILLRRASQFFPGHQRETARQIHARLSIYRNGRWRRDRSAERCPPQHRGRPEEIWWLISKCHDHTPSEMTIRRSLFVNHQP
jgi:hypothetical protein